MCYILEQTLVFGGIRFEVEGSAILLFSEETATEFKGVNNLVRRTTYTFIVKRFLLKVSLICLCLVTHSSISPQSLCFGLFFVFVAAALSN